MPSYTMRFPFPMTDEMRSLWPGAMIGEQHGMTYDMCVCVTGCYSLLAAGCSLGLAAVTEQGQQGSCEAHTGAMSGQGQRGASIGMPCDSEHPPFRACYLQSHGMQCAVHPGHAGMMRGVLTLMPMLMLMNAMPPPPRAAARVRACRQVQRRPNFRQAQSGWLPQRPPDEQLHLLPGERVAGWVPDEPRPQGGLPRDAHTCHSHSVSGQDQMGRLCCVRRPAQQEAGATTAACGVAPAARCVCACAEPRHAPADLQVCSRKNPGGYPFTMGDRSIF
jgi:hypothetical protein